MGEFDLEVRQFFEQANCAQGMDDSIAKIVAELYPSPDEISLDELAKRTGYSLASISNKVKFLEQAGLVQRTRKPGSKKVFLYMEKDIIHHMKKHLIIKQEHTIALAKNRIPEIIKKYKGAKLSLEQKKKLKIMESYYEQIKRSDEIISKILKLMNEM